MDKPLALVTGARGEMGHELVPALHERGFQIVAVDLLALDPSLRSLCAESVEASILDSGVMQDLTERYDFDQVFHLAAVLSHKAEREPDLAHRVNVEGTYNLFRLCDRASRRMGRTLRLMFPSSIAVYGLPDAATKERAGAVKETDWVTPKGLYGCNKVYGEMIGAYLSERARQSGAPGLDFRCIRFPGLISAETLPTGGTTDYTSEMIHAAAQGKPYSCFIGERTRLPFMTMPDAIEALLTLAAAPGPSLTTSVYNIRGFSPSAGEIRDAVLKHFPAAKIGFEPAPARQAIVDTWPADVDDGLARRDWGLAPKHGLEEALGQYLVPALRSRYAAEAPRPSNPGDR